MSVRWKIDKRQFWLEAIDANLGESLNEIARSFDVAPSTLSRVLGGKTQPGAELLARMRHRLGRDAYERVVRLEEFVA